MLAVNLANIVHAADIGMRHLPRHPDFVVETRERAFVAGHGLREKLQGHRLA